MGHHERYNCAIFATIKTFFKEHQYATAASHHLHYSDYVAHHSWAMTLDLLFERNNSIRGVESVGLG
jgi:hypothetical protein